jgi:hypothetical protein
MAPKHDDVGRDGLLAMIEQLDGQLTHALNTLTVLAKERSAYLANLSETQRRCTELLEENRLMKARIAELEAQ